MSDRSGTEAAAGQHLAAQRIAALERTVEQQQQRLSQLESTVHQQRAQLSHLEAFILRQQAASAMPRMESPGLPAQHASEAALSDSMKQLTGALERKLRASDAFVDAGLKPELSNLNAASPPQAVGRPQALGAAAGGLAERPHRASCEFTTPPPVPMPTSGAAAAAGLLIADTTIVPWALSSHGGSRAGSQSASQNASREPTPPDSDRRRTPRPNISAGRTTAPAAGGPVTASFSPAVSGDGVAKASAAHSRRRGSPSARPAMGGSSRPASGSSGAGRSRPSSGRRHPRLEQVATLETQQAEQPVTGIAVSECGGGLVSAGLDGQLQLWSLADEPQGLGTTTRSAQSWRRTLTQPVGGGEINGIALCGSLLACGCQDGSVRLFRLLKEGGSFVLYSLLRKQHTGALGTPSADATAAAPGQGGVSAPAATAPTEVMCVTLSTAHASRNSPLLASGAQDGSVCLWDSSSGRLVRRFEAHARGGKGWVMALVLARHEDGRRGLLLTASYDHTVRVWMRPADDIGGGAVGASWGWGADCNGSGCGHSAFASDTSAGGTGAGTGWTLAHTLEGHTDGVLGVELSRTRRHAFSSSEDRSVRAWELQSGACLCVMQAHESSVSAIGWHPSSGCLATGAEDGIVHLWDVSALEESPGHPGPGAVGEIKPCRLVQTLCIEHSEVLCLATSADGTAIFCGLDDGAIALLAASSATEPPTDRAVVAAERPYGGKQGLRASPRAK
jgi:WD40 repeat protein